MKVLLLGSTGLVGSEVLKLALADPTIEKVHLLARHNSGVESSKIIEFIGPLDEMDKHPEAFSVDAVICCLGTTIKKAGSKAQFKMVDYNYPLAAAKLAKESGVKSYCIVTALGANSKSKVFYNRVKGELERDLKGLAFQRLAIVRPSIIVGVRKERRFGEAVGIFAAKMLSPLFIGPIKKYGGSKVKDIANLVIQLAKDETPKSYIGFEIKQLK